ncbi:MAG: hypothetical protein CL608_23690 [Anaerolineaceae bacterium]|nr:hypothetical protein [Anaerolineaceae bacterium]
MKLAAPTTLTKLEQAIWRTVAYVDLFDYPLTAVEIHRYLDSVPATASEVARMLVGSAALTDHLSHHAGFFCLPQREEIVEIRHERRRRAQQLWPEAVRYGRLIARLPFVRMVAVTGSLAMNNVAEDADIDYFLVTENGRLWLTRALVIAIVRLAARRGVILCPNYFVAESALTLPERNIYTAREIVQMVPLFGHDIYKQLRQHNCWASQFMPNADGPPLVQIPEPEPASWPQTVAELPLRTPLGAWLEQWEQARKIEKLRSQQNGSGESLFTAVICKGHFQAHQQRTLTAYQHRLNTSTDFADYTDKNQNNLRKSA